MRIKRRTIHKMEKVFTAVIWTAGWIAIWIALLSRL